MKAKMKASSKQNHFDVITSKVRRNRDYCVGQVFLSVVYMPTMNYSCLYLAELRSVQNRCNFATICARKGYGGPEEQLPSGFERKQANAQWAATGGN